MNYFFNCPHCGNQHSFVKNIEGREVKCPSCATAFIASALIPPPKAPPAPANLPGGIPAVQILSPAKTALAQPEGTIRYSCVRCKKSLESPSSFGGQKINCPSCGQRLQIPAALPPIPEMNKTVMAVDETNPQPKPQAPPMVMPVSTAQAAPSSGSALIPCKDCGAMVSKNAKACPKCGCPTPEIMLIQCVDCGNEVSRNAKVCPKCGCPIQELLHGRTHDRLSSNGGRPKPARPNSGLCIAFTGLVLSGIGAGIIGILMANYNPSPEGRGFGVFCILFAGAALFISFFVFLAFLERGWSYVSRNEGDPSPGAAIGLLFAPFFNMYWMFCVIPGLSAAILRELYARDQSRFHIAGWGVGLAACISSLALCWTLYGAAIPIILFLVWMNLANSALNRLIRLDNQQRTGSP